MNNEKKGEDFKKSALENNIHLWSIHHCSFCYYECKFLFDLQGYEVVYDSGCYCTNSRTIRISSWDSVAVQYNCNLGNIETIKRYNEYWKFKE
jgi:hypothetical protein